MIKRNTSEHFLLKQLIKKNFTAKYKDSILGILWSFINPLLTMLLLTAIFSTIFSGNIENYPVYFLAGRCLFDFYSAATKTAMNSIKGNSGILKRIFVPRYIFAFGGICSEFVNFLISLIILIAVMYLTGLHLTLISFAVIIPIVILFVMTAGIGLILSIMCTYFRDIEYLYIIDLNRMEIKCYKVDGNFIEECDDDISIINGDCPINEKSYCKIYTMGFDVETH